MTPELNDHIIYVSADAEKGQLVSYCESILCQEACGYMLPTLTTCEEYRRIQTIIDKRLKIEYIKPCSYKYSLKRCNILRS